MEFFNVNYIVLMDNNEMFLYDDNSWGTKIGSIKTFNSKKEAHRYKSMQDKSCSIQIINVKMLIKEDKPWIK